MKRGSLCWVDLTPSKSPEFGKTRPAIVVSNSDQNLVLPTLVVVPISSQPPAIPPLRVAFRMPRGKASFAVIPGIRQVSRHRIRSVVGMVDPRFLESLTEAIVEYLRD